MLRVIENYLKDVQSPCFFPCMMSSGGPHSEPYRALIIFYTVYHSLIGCQSCRQPSGKYICYRQSKALWQIARRVLATLWNSTYLSEGCQCLLIGSLLSTHKTTTWDIDLTERPIHRLNLERLNREFDFCPNGLNPEWDWTPNGPNPAWIQSQIIKNGPNLEWTQPRIYSTQN